MAKSVGRACAQIAILLTIFGSIQCVKSISPDAYSVQGATKLAYIQPDEILRLSPGALSARQRRDAPTEASTEATLGAARTSISTLDAKNQYQSVSANGSAATAAATTAAAVAADGAVTTVDGKATAAGSVSYNVHNVGVNGTGQRKDYSNGSSNGTNINSDASGAVPDVPPKKAQLAAQPSQYPKKVAASAVPVTTSTSTERSLIDEIDVPDEVITNGAKNASLTRREDHYDYYRSVMYVNKKETSTIWTQLSAIPENNMLSSSHRRAMTVELTFDFPFYGHNVRNITVATGGFLYTGEYVHSWLAATQYIAPLMANFDTSMADDSFVRLQDNGTAFTVVWENVTLQDKPDYGKFTFSATLHQNGDIVFVYYKLPMSINNIQDNQHPVKVGLSDAYIMDKRLIFARRKTIYEYHRVTFGQQEITNDTVIYVTALPTCLAFNDCDSCVNHNTTFECGWCPTLNRCSTNNGNDRRKQEWQQKGCYRSLINVSSSCPALGQKGNNAAQENAANSSSSSSSSDGDSSSKSSANGNYSGGTMFSSTPAANGAAGSSAATEPTVSSTHISANGAARNDGANMEKSEHLGAVLPDNKNVGVAFGFLVPICLVFAVTLWLFYAYRNPHTRSGQLLIQFRPSQWAWRRGEARYTAATIHM